MLGNLHMLHSNLAGMATETLIRTLIRFKKEGCIQSTTVISGLWMCIVLAGSTDSKQVLSLLAKNFRRGLSPLRI